MLDLLEFTGVRVLYFDPLPGDFIGADYRLNLPALGSFSVIAHTIYLQVLKICWV